MITWFFLRVKYTLSFVLVLVLSACSGGAETKANSPQTTLPVKTSSINYHLAPVSGATCSLYDIDEVADVSDLRRVKALVTATTDNGVATFSELSFEGPALLQCRGGSFLDEATSRPNTPAPGLVNAVIEYAPGSSFTISLATHMAVMRAKGDLRSALGDGGYNEQIADVFGLEGVDISGVVPTDLNVSSADTGYASRYGLVLAALSMMDSLDGSININHFVNNLATDVNNVDAMDGAVLREAVNRFVNGGSIAAANIQGARNPVVIVNRAVGEGVSSVDVPLTEMKLSGAATINVGPGTRLEIALSPVDATNPLVNWQSSDPAIAKVNKQGFVTGISSGQVDITATSRANPEIQGIHSLTVTTVDITKPVITLQGDNPLQLITGAVFTDPGVQAVDDVDGDISAQVVIGGDSVNTSVEGTYLITYDVSDAANNDAVQKTRNVIVVDAVDNIKPEIQLLGSNPINLFVGAIYNEPGATSSDNVDGDITANISIDSDSVNSAVVGTYAVTYNVSDNAGNAAEQKTRTVIVNKLPDVTSPSSMANPAGGSYNSAQDVVLSSDDASATIYYTLNGNNPTTSSNVYSSAIRIGSNATLRYFAEDNLGNREAVNTAVYVIDTAAPSSMANPAGGSYNSAQDVVLSSDDASATIYYTLNGSSPTTSSNVYSSAIRIGSNATLRYFAEDNLGNREAVNTESYNISVETALQQIQAAVASDSFTTISTIVTRQLLIDAVMGGVTVVADKMTAYHKVLKAIEASDIVTVDQLRALINEINSWYDSSDNGLYLAVALANNKFGNVNGAYEYRLKLRLENSANQLATELARSSYDLFSIRNAVNLVNNYLDDIESFRVQNGTDNLVLLGNMPTNFSIIDVARTRHEPVAGGKSFYLIDDWSGLSVGRYKSSRLFIAGRSSLLPLRDASAVDNKSDILRGALTWLTEQTTTPYRCTNASCANSAVRVASFSNTTVDSAYRIALTRVNANDVIDPQVYPVFYLPRIDSMSNAEYQTLLDYIEAGGNLLVAGQIWSGTPWNDDERGAALTALYGLETTKNWNAYSSADYSLNTFAKTVENTKSGRTYDLGDVKIAPTFVSVVRDQAAQIAKAYTADSTLNNANSQLQSTDFLQNPSYFLHVYGETIKTVETKLVNVQPLTGINFDDISDELVWNWNQPFNEYIYYQYSINGGQAWFETYENPMLLPNLNLPSGHIRLRQRVDWSAFDFDVFGQVATINQPATAQIIDSFTLHIDAPIATTADGMGSTVFGRTDGIGVDLVLVAESFRSQDRAVFEDVARQYIETQFENQPGMKVHRNGWNIHLLFAASNERGVDFVEEICTDDVNWEDCTRNQAERDATETTHPSYFHDTKFNAGMFCTGNSATWRLLCADTGAARDYVDSYYPHADQILILVNTTQYGGAGGSVGISSKSSYSVAVHEMGHSFAGLRDEYTYGHNDDPVSHTFNDPDNATNNPNWNQSVWRHWIDDTNINGSACTENDKGDSNCQSVTPEEKALGGNYKIGFYEGAHYHSEGIWRPTNNSLMRSTGPLYAVNTEIWANHVYQHSGVFEVTHPLPNGIDDTDGTNTNTALQVSRGQHTDFIINLRIGAGIQKVEWYINGNLHTADGRTVLSYGASETSPYTVRVKVTDITGTIRKDIDSTTSREFTWNVTPVNGSPLQDLLADVLPPPPFSSTIVKLKWDQQSHNVVSWLHSGAIAKQSNVVNPDTDLVVAYRITGSAGEVLYEGEQGIGGIIRSPGLIDGGYAQHTVVTLDQGSYSISFPYNTEVRYLEIHDDKQQDLGWQSFDLQTVPQLFN